MEPASAETHSNNSTKLSRDIANGRSSSRGNRGRVTVAPIPSKISSTTTKTATAIDGTGKNGVVVRVDLRKTSSTNSSKSKIHATSKCDRSRGRDKSRIPTTAIHRGRPIHMVSTCASNKKSSDDTRRRRRSGPRNKKNTTKNNLSVCLVVVEVPTASNSSTTSTARSKCYAGSCAWVFCSSSFQLCGRL